MHFTEFLEGPIPHSSKRASRFGVAQGAFVHTERLQRGGRKGGDDLGGVFLLHGPTMPNFLTCVKPSDGGLQQVPWRGNLPVMDLDEKPFGDIAERIRWHRALMGTEQLEYAEKAGLKRSQVSNWESGSYRLSLDGARALRRTYGLSLDFMFEGIDDALSMSLRKAWNDRPKESASK